MTQHCAHCICTPHGPKACQTCTCRGESTAARDEREGNEWADAREYEAMRDLVND